MDGPSYPPDDQPPRAPLLAPTLVLDASRHVLQADTSLRALFGRDDLVGMAWDELVVAGPTTELLLGDADQGDLEIVTRAGAHALARARRVGQMHVVTLSPESEDGLLSTALLVRAVDAANNSIVISDRTQPDDPLVYVNRGFEELTGYTFDEAVGRNCRFLQTPPEGHADPSDDEAQEQARARIREVLQAGTYVGGVVLRNYRKDGRRFYNELYLTPVRGAGGEVTHVVGVQNDVTERIEAERALQGRVSQLQRFFDAMPVPLGLLERGPDGVLRHRLGNRAAADAFDLPLGEPIASGAMGFRSASDALWARAVARLDRTHVPVRFEAPRENGRTYEVTLASIMAPGAGPRYFYLATDITDGLAYEADRLDASQHQIERVAQDIHDGVGQTLAGSQMLMAALAGSLRDEGHPRAAEAERLRELLALAVSQLRRFALGLDPLDLEGGDLMRGLVRLSDHTQTLFGVTVELETPPALPLLAAQTVHDLYRIAQEAITNAVRHGQAQTVRVEIECAEGVLSLAVVDDGVGMRPEAVSAEGLGLRSMRMRARRHGGALTVGAADSGGTVVRAEVPIRAED